MNTKLWLKFLTYTLGLQLVLDILNFNILKTCLCVFQSIILHSTSINFLLNLILINFHNVQIPTCCKIEFNKMVDFLFVLKIKFTNKSIRNCIIITIFKTDLSKNI